MKRQTHFTFHVSLLTFDAMNWLDAVIALIIFIPTYFGFIDGFLKKVLLLLGLAAGFIAAVKLLNPVGSFVIDILHSPPAPTLVIVFTLLILVVYLLFMYASRYTSNMHPAAGLINTFLGTAAGFLQGVLISSILLFNLSYLNFPSASVREGSAFYDKVFKIAPAFFDKIISYFPGSKNIYEEYKRLNE